MRDADVDLGDVVRAGSERPRLDRGLCHCLRELAERIALGEGATDAEGLAKLRRLDRLLAHHLEETVGALEHLRGTGHAVLRELDREHRLAAGVGRSERLPVR